MQPSLRWVGRSRNHRRSTPEFRPVPANGDKAGHHAHQPHTVQASRSARAYSAPAVPHYPFHPLLHRSHDTQRTRACAHYALHAPSPPRSRSIMQASDSSLDQACGYTSATPLELLMPRLRRTRYARRHEGAAPHRRVLKRRTSARVYGCVGARIGEEEEGEVGPTLQLGEVVMFIHHSHAAPSFPWWVSLAAKAKPSCMSLCESWRSWTAMGSGPLPHP